jgi:16S rRNA (adenine1518-N6/adenine1519-N6)-dimethyltransferase
LHPEKCVLQHFGVQSFIFAFLEPKILYTGCMLTLADTVRRFCIKQGLKMNTDLGQHFLIDDTILAAIVEAANIQKDDEVLEIGAGIGILTHELLRKTKHVTTIEIDTKLIPLLHAYIKACGENKVPTVIPGNALNVTFPEKPYKIVANIPYHITSPLLRHAFLESTQTPTSLTLLIQREVAEKICDTTDAGILTIVVALFGKPRIVVNVPPKAFLPPPKVDSAVLHIDCFSEPLTDPATMERVFMLTKHGFSQKRKMLRNTLGSLPSGMEMMEALHIEPTRRPQTLSIHEWIQLAQYKQ